MFFLFLAGEDYTALSGQCTFSSTSPTCTFQVSIRDDFDVEDLESFNIFFSSLNPSACIVQGSSITINIIDDGTYTYTSEHIIFIIVLLLIVFVYYNSKS